jgi:adenylate cyclase
VVRIEAGRIRRALEHYYLLAGRNDPIVVEIPKGGYVPNFRIGTQSATAEAAPSSAPTIEAAPSSAPAVEPAPSSAPAVEPAPSSAPAVDPPRSPRAWPKARWLGAAGAALIIFVAAVAWYFVRGASLQQQETAQLPAGPSLLVLPFVDLGEGTTSSLYSAALTDELVTSLAHFKEITVLSVHTSQSVGAKADIVRLHDELKVRYVLEGSVRANADAILVRGRLFDATSGAVLWSQQYENPLTAANLFSIEVSTANDVAAAIAQPYGIVVQAEEARAPSHPPDDLEAYLCTLQYYVYRSAPTPELHATLRSCLERAVARFPTYSTAWALLAQIYTDEARHGLNLRAGDQTARRRAVSAGRKAVRLDPENPRALQALATALFYSRQPDEALDYGRRALALTPNDPELQGQIGQLLGLSGQLVEGRFLLQKAVAKNPGRSGFYRGALALVAYMQRDYDTAVAEIDKADLQQLPIYFGVAAEIYAQKGLDERARAAAAEFQRLSPDFVPNLWAELDSRNMPREMQLHVADGLRKAGMTIPPLPVVGRAGD